MRPDLTTRGVKTQAKAWTATEGRVYSGCKLWDESNLGVCSIRSTLLIMRRTNIEYDSNIIDYSAKSLREDSCFVVRASVVLQMILLSCQSLLSLAPMPLESSDFKIETCQRHVWVSMMVVTLSTPVIITETATTASFTTSLVRVTA
jgi:hypothetical protein